MQVSDAFRQLIAALPDNFNLPDDDVATVRQKMAPMHGHPVAKYTQVSNDTVGAMDVVWLQAGSYTASGRHVLFCHGGGFVSCTANEYLFYAEYIGRYLDAKVLIPDYRLAPEHQYPAALDDCFAAYRYMLDQRIDPATIILTGDSCGGGLAMATILRAAQEEFPLPACYVGLTSWYDLTLPGASGRDPGGKDPFITPGWYHARVKDYMGDTDPALPMASPAKANCSGLPPMLLQVGGTDITRDSAVEMARVAGQAGVTVELQIWSGMVHGFHGLAGSDIPESLAAWEAARSFVDKHTAM